VFAPAPVAADPLARRGVQVARRDAAKDAAPLHVDTSTAAGRRLVARARRQQAALAQRRSGATAGVLHVLDQVARPVHGIAGATDALVQGHGLAGAHHALTRGLENKDRKTFSDVLHHAGVHGPVAGVAGFGLDVALDPTTYLTFGAGSVARNAGERELARVLSKARAAGMSDQGARTVAARAARIAEGRAPSGSGASVRVAGREVPGVRRATAATARVSGRAGRRVAQAPVVNRVAARATRTGQAGRELVREVRPQMAPAGADRAQFEVARRAARQARAEVNLADRQNQAYAHALHKAIGPDRFEQVVHAIETRTVHRLPEDLKTSAVSLRSRFRHAKRLRAHAGIGEGTIRDYFPHARQDVLESGLGISAQPVEGARPRGSFGPGGRTVTRPGSAKARSDRRTLSAINPERAAHGLEPFSTNVPLVALNYLNETARTVSKANFFKSLAGAGRRVKPGQGTLHLRDGEAVYRLGFEPGSKVSTHLADAKGGAEVMLRSGAGRGRFGLREVDDREVQQVLGGSGKPGQYVVLNRQTVEDALKSTESTRARHVSGRAIDRVTGGFKRVATATPGFHVRNAVGDTQMAYLGQPGYRLPVNAAQAARLVRRVSQVERQSRVVRLVPTKSAATVKVAGKHMLVDDLLAGARKNGVIRSGYIGRELEDLTGAAVGGAKRVRRGTGDTLKRWMQNREDWMRLATYKHGLDQGLSEGAAADLAAKIHIDYGDLTETERRYLRRLLPFYTFTGRALPLHVQALLTRPGKFANIEKAREEVAKGTGVDPANLPKVAALFVQRQAPFVLRIGGRAVGLSASLPLTLLNEVPTSTNVGQYLGELAQFTAGLVNPVVKDPVELYANRSFFFRRDIEDQKRPLVAAPSWVQHLPHRYWKELGITDQYVDPRTGKKTWGWRGRADYLAKVVPGPVGLAQQLLSPGTNRRGQGLAGKILGGALGVRVDPLDKTAAQGAARTRLFQQLAGLQRQQGMLNQQGINAHHPTPEYMVVSQRMKQIQVALDQLDQGTAKQSVVLSPAQQKGLARAQRLAARSTANPAALERALARARRAASHR
jgi:hypothetical protein